MQPMLKGVWITDLHDTLYDNLGACIAWRIDSYETAPPRYLTRDFPVCMNTLPILKVLNCKKEKL